MASKEAEEVEEVEKTDIGSGSSSSAMVGENTDIVKKHIETKIAIFNLPKHWNKRTSSVGNRYISFSFFF